MADRDFAILQTQGNRHVNLNFGVKLVAGSPVFVEGDTAASITGSYLTLTDTGVGIIGVTTTNPYLAVVKVTGSRAMGTPTTNSGWIFSLPTQNTNGTWTFTITTWTNAAGTHTAADMAAGDIMYVDLVLRNSGVLP
jgi:hypothetical protein